MQITELEQGFYIGPWHIEPKLNRLSTQIDDENVEHIVTPKVMALFLLLAQKQGEPVNQQEIAEQVWPTLAISDSSIYQAIAQLRKALNDTQPQKQYIERVSGKGYCLIKTVTLSNMTSLTTVNKKHAVSTSNVSLQFKTLIALVTALIIFVSVWAIRPLNSIETAVNADITISSIAIRPTENLTRPQQEQFNTLGHLLLADLMSIPNIDLILIRDNNQRSNADAELTHTISTNNEQLILSAQLVDNNKHRVIWAKNFRAHSDALFELKTQMITALKAELTQEPTGNSETQSLNENLGKKLYESFVLAQYLWHKREPEALIDAKHLYEDILQKQPDNVETLVGLCNTYLFLHIYSDWSEEKAFTACSPLIAQASDLAPYNGKVLATKAALLPTEQSERAAALFKQAMIQSPSYAEAYLWYGNFLRAKGSLDDALKMHQKALSLDPLSPNINRSYAYSLLNLRRLQEAKQYYQRALAIEPNYSLRPVEELDFLLLNIDRAHKFIQWSQHNASNLGKRAPYLLTQALVRLGLGQSNKAKLLVEQVDQTEVSKAFLLYVQAALYAAENNTTQALALLEKRYKLGKRELDNSNRYVMPYLNLLIYTGQPDKAYNLFTRHFPQIQLDEEISLQNSGQFVFLNEMLISQGMAQKHNVLSKKLTRYFNDISHPRSTLPYIQWLVQSEQHEKAISKTEALFEAGWLPDINDNILAETNLRNTYIAAGGNENTFNSMLEKNRRLAME